MKLLSMNKSDEIFYKIIFLAWRAQLQIL